jgi:hypothetical protein
MVTQHSAGVAVVNQFKILMFAAMLVRPLIALRHKPRPVS